MEKIAHIRISDRDFSVYIGFSYETMTLYAYKYDDHRIDFNWFTDVEEFKYWVMSPL